MKRVLILCVVMLGISPAWADSFFNQTPPNAPYTSSGTTASRSPQARGADVYNVKDFGAIGNGTTDDTAAINATFAAARSGQKNVPVSGPSPIGCVIFPTGYYLITDTINVTGFAGPSLCVDGQGSIILGKTTGKPMIDGLGTRFLNFNNLTLLGDATNKPTIGIQIGRISSASADDHEFRAINIVGSFSFTAFYNFAGEGTSFYDCFFENVNTADASYALVLDGTNHWNITSAFVTNTSPVDTARSFLKNTFINTELVSSSATGAGIWMSNTSEHAFYGSYLATHGHGVVMDMSVGTIKMLDVDIHIEPPDVPDMFFVTGSNANPNIGGIRYKDSYSEVVNSVFAVDAGITKVTINNFDVKIQEFLTPSATMFDDPSKYNVSGDVYVPATGNWNEPSLWQGSVRIGANQSNIGRTPGGTSTGNLALGDSSGIAITSGANNTFFGKSAGQRVTSGGFISAFGTGALQNMLTGSGSAFGFGALANATGISNDAFGSNSCGHVSTGTANLCLGGGAGNITLQTGSNNILIGRGVDTEAAGTSHEINIGGLLFYNKTTTAAPAPSACGTSPTIDGRANNRSGTVGIGSGGPTSCTITFAGSGYSSFNHCRVTPHTANTTFGYSYNLTAITVTGTGLTGFVDYDCDGY